ncbi:MAG: 30S ribosomal protein S6 [Candidatus Doudnabacteria bacterium]|nr:30S ribosomal protein S6 [Candidatus Doudnabacteria bacterium]
MPKYELMYLLGSTVADTEVPAVTQRVLKHIEDFGGSEVSEQQLGKKKLAYPIKKTRNGFYVVVNFDIEANKVNELDARIRTQEHEIIRYILVNQDEHLRRLSRDKVAQAKLTQKPEVTEEVVAKAAPIEKVAKEEKPSIKIEEIDDAALDKKIEEALTEDLTK